MDEFITTHTLDAEEVSFENGNDALSLIVYSEEGRYDSIGFTVASHGGQVVPLSCQPMEWGFEIDCDSAYRSSFEVLFSMVCDHIAEQYGYEWAEKPQTEEL